MFVFRMCLMYAHHRHVTSKCGPWRFSTSFQNLSVYLLKRFCTLVDFFFFPPPLLKFNQPRIKFFISIFPMQSRLSQRSYIWLFMHIMATSDIFWVQIISFVSSEKWCNSQPRTNLTWNKTFYEMSKHWWQVFIATKSNVWKLVNWHKNDICMRSCKCFALVTFSRENDV